MKQYLKAFGPVFVAALVAGCAHLKGESAGGAQPAGAAPIVATAPSSPSMPMVGASAARMAASAPRLSASAPRLSASAPRAAASGAAGDSDAPGAAPSTAAGSPTTPPLRPFDVVIKDAKREVGFFTTWHKEDKVWIEVPPAMWDQRFFFSVNVTHGIGDGGLYGNRMGAFSAAGRGQYIASFKRFGVNGVHLVAHNTRYLAKADNPARHIIERSFSDSLLGQASVLSRPHPESKAVLIEANAFILNDFPGGASALEQAFRQTYAFDARNSSIERVRNSEHETGFNVRAHYATARLAQPSPNAPPGAPAPRVPSTLPDARSLFMGYYYGLSKLPEPMRTRVADPRVEPCGRHPGRHFDRAAGDRALRGQAHLLDPDPAPLRGPCGGGGRSRHQGPARPLRGHPRRPGGGGHAGLRAGGPPAAPPRPKPRRAGGGAAAAELRSREYLTAALG